MSGSITIKSFRAIDEPETCEKFFEGHVEVLRSYGVKTISSSKHEWFFNPAVYGVVAGMNGRLIGGVKIHKVGGTQLLPVEEAVAERDKRLYGIVEKYALNGAGEACGLWNSREVAGWGVSMLMMMAVVSISNQIGVNTLFGLSSDHTLPMFRKLGYKIIRSLGNKGDFVYPTEAYLARVIKMNAQTLSSANPYNREIMFALRGQPNQKRLEMSKRSNLEVTYKLLLK